MNIKKIIFPGLVLFFLLSGAPQVKSATEDSTPGSNSQPETAIVSPVLAVKLPEPSLRKNLPLLEPLSAIEKIFNPTNKTRDFEIQVQGFYDDLRKPDFNLELSLNKIRRVDVLRQFGYDFFMLEPSTFSPVTDQPAGSEYLLGPGDEVVINAWGLLDGNYRLTVDRSGEIFIPKVGQIVLAGRNIAEAEDLIKNSFARYYKEPQVSVGLGRLRTIRVFVSGEVKNPGSYEMGSLSTLLNALYFSGGPSKNGSLRKIKLIRGTKTADTVDLYRFLLFGDKSQDYVLQSGDVVFVEPVGKVAAVFGNQVKRPGIYEISDGATLRDLIEASGGLFNLGAKPQIKIAFLNNQPAEPATEALTPEKNYVLNGGETILISSDILSMENDRQATIEGEVAMPGKYVIRSGETLRELLKRAGGLNKTAFLYGAILTRKTIQEKQQENLDRFLKTQSQMIINRALRNEGKDSLNDTIKQQEAMVLLVSRLTPGRINLNLAQMLDTGKDLPLEDGDRLFIPAEPETVQMLGAVNVYASIIYEPGKDLNWYISHSGGYAKYADRKGVFIIHPDGTASGNQEKNQNIRRGDTIIIPEDVYTSRWTLSKEIVRMFYEIALPAAAFFK